MKANRLTVIGGVTVKVKTACGSMYIQMNWQNGRLFEVFASLGKTGGCAFSWSEALTRSITLGLRNGVPVGEYVSQLVGIRCPSPTPFPKESAVWSCADALSKTLGRYGGLGVEDIVAMIRRVNEIVVSSDEEEKLALAEIEQRRRERPEE